MRAMYGVTHIQTKHQNLVNHRRLFILNVHNDPTSIGHADIEPFVDFTVFKIFREKFRARVEIVLSLQSICAILNGNSCIEIEYVAWHADGIYRANLKVQKFKVSHFSSNGEAVDFHQSIKVNYEPIVSTWNEVFSVSNDITHKWKILFSFRGVEINSWYALPNHTAIKNIHIFSEDKNNKQTNPVNSPPPLTSCHWLWNAAIFGYLPFSAVVVVGMRYCRGMNAVRAHKYNGNDLIHVYTRWKHSHGST